MQRQTTENHSERESCEQATGQNPAMGSSRVDEEPATQSWTKAEPTSENLMEIVVSRNNLWLAYDRVCKNKGSAGVDGIEIPEFKAHLQRHWLTIKAKLLAGTYIPHPVRRVEIPKPQGGIRTLGIPTLSDRLIQQALHQVLSPQFEPEFSDSSYGFRPGRSALQAVHAAQEHVAQGNRWIVDIDLEKFFDRVNHDILMSKIAQKVKDQRVLKLIRRYLEAGMHSEGITETRTEGTPQGGPLSPLLSNILLGDLDRELEKRNHRFCRYADDCNIYVRSKKAGARVIASVTNYLQQRLKLKVNESKSAVARPWERKFLGYSMSIHKKPRVRIAPSSVERFENTVRETLRRRSRGQSLTKTIAALNPLLRGWIQYFRLTQVKGVLERLDSWIRRKLRCILWRQWKRPYSRAKRLMQAGLAEQRAWQSAMNGRGAWWNSGASHMNSALPKKYFDRLGLVSLQDTHRRLQL